MATTETQTDPRSQPAPTFDDVWRMFQETREQMREDAEKQREAHAAHREAQEAHQKAQEEHRKAQQETDRQLKETTALVNQLSRDVAKTSAEFDSRWGRLMESLVEGDLISILNRRGIEICDTTSRLRGKLRDGGHYEFDIIAHNGDEVVVVEVKTTLRPKDVKKFGKKLEQFKRWVPRYKKNKVYGAMAYLSEDSEAVGMAEKRGMFVIRATGDSAAVVNAEKFKPRIW